jgi:hypothetical protein
MEPQSMRFVGSEDEEPATARYQERSTDAQDRSQTDGADAFACKTARPRPCPRPGPPRMVLAQRRAHLLTTLCVVLAFPQPHANRPR